MSVSNYYSPVSVVPKFDQNINPQQVQKILDENVGFIHSIMEKQTNNQDYTDLLKQFHKNLIYLATHADQATSSTPQPIHVIPTSVMHQPPPPHIQYQSPQPAFQTQPITPVSATDGTSDSGKTQPNTPTNKDDSLPVNGVNSSSSAEEHNQPPSSVVSTSGGDIMPPPSVNESPKISASPSSSNQQSPIIYQQQQRMLYPPPSGYPPPHTQYLPMDPAGKFYPSPYTQAYGAYQNMYAAGGVPGAPQHSPYQAMPMPGPHYPNQQPPIMYSQQYPFYGNPGQAPGPVHLIDPQQQAQMMIPPNQLPPHMMQQIPPTTNAVVCSAPPSIVHTSLQTTGSISATASSVVTPTTPVLTPTSVALSPITPPNSTAPTINSTPSSISTSITDQNSSTPPINVSAASKTQNE